MVVKIAPSILAANFTRLGEEVAAVEKAGADWLHLDVMDGHFVPNLSFGPPVIKALRSVTALPFDVHLMVTNPHDLLQQYVAAGADHITVHLEAATDTAATLKAIHAFGKKVGLSLRPTTPAAMLEKFLPLVDLILVMSVEPGFGGQEFQPQAIEKIKEIKRMVDAHAAHTPRPIDIVVDGGITPNTAPQVKKAGATVLVAGSSVFKQKNYQQAIKALRGAA